MKKIIQFILCLMMLFGSINVYAANPTVEISSVNSARITEGNSYIADLTVNNLEDIDSVKVYYNFYDSLISIDFNYTGDGHYEGSYSYDSYMQSGKYQAAKIEITDQEGNVTSITDNISALDFECYSIYTVDHLSFEAGSSMAKTYYLYSNFDFVIESSDESVANAAITEQGMRSLNGNTYYTREVTFYGNHPGTASFYLKSEENIVRVIRVTITKKTFSFTDVEEGKWFYPYIQEAYNLGLMTGKSEDTFDPYANMTRGQVAVVLYRMAGSPEVEYAGVFPDVLDGKYYSDAIEWAAANGIVTGYGDGTFKPSNNVTRQEFALMLERYVKQWCKKEVSEGADLSAFPDASNVSGYATEAMQWAVANGIISGKKVDGVTCLAPKATATRAECCKMLVVANQIMNN